MPQGSKPDDQEKPLASQTTELKDQGTGTCAASPSDVLCDAPCKTSPLLEDFSICMMNQRGCQHALSFGNSYLCRHPEHAKFAASGYPKTHYQKADKNMKQE